MSFVDEGLKGPSVFGSFDRPRVQKFFNKPSLTRQEFKQDCDLGLLLKRFGRTPEGKRALESAYGFAQNLRFEDVSAVPDFRTARDAVNAANERFMALPALLRRRFNNDPAEFLDFALNPSNLDEMRALGLAKPLAQEPERVAEAASSTPPVKG